MKYISRIWNNKMVVYILLFLLSDSIVYAHMMYVFRSLWTLTNLFNYCFIQQHKLSIIYNFWCRKFTLMVTGLMMSQNLLEYQLNSRVVAAEMSWMEKKENLFLWTKLIKNDEDTYNFTIWHYLIIFIKNFYFFTKLFQK